MNLRFFIVFVIIIFTTMLSGCNIIDDLFTQNIESDYNPGGVLPDRWSVMTRLGGQALALSEDGEEYIKLILKPSQITSDGRSSRSISLLFGGGVAAWDLEKLYKSSNNRFTMILTFEVRINSSEDYSYLDIPGNGGIKSKSSNVLLDSIPKNDWVTINVLCDRLNVALESQVLYSLYKNEWKPGWENSSNFLVFSTVSILEKHKAELWFTFFGDFDLDIKNIRFWESDGW